MAGEIMNILLSSDDNYARHLGVAVHSLLRHNTAAGRINVYVIDNNISEANRGHLREMTAGFANASIHFIDFDKWRGMLKLDLPWDISLSSYARIFVGSMLPAAVHRVLYMDCDMIVCRALTELWTQDLGGSIVGAVQDTVPPQTKTMVELSAGDPYFNAGLLLIDLDKWRAEGVEQECVDFVTRHNGRVTHHDQGILNGVLRGRWSRLPLACNLMTINYVFTPRQIAKYYKDPAAWYTPQEVEAAKREPAILHYTPSFTSRPWVKTCLHPLRGLYWDEIKDTPWSGAKAEPDMSKTVVRLVNWWYRTFGA